MLLNNHLWSPTYHQEDGVHICWNWKILLERPFQIATSNMLVVLNPFLPHVCIAHPITKKVGNTRNQSCLSEYPYENKTGLFSKKKIVLITDQPWPTELQCWKCGVNHSFVMQMNGNWCSVSQLYILADQFPAVIPLCSSWQKTSTGYTREPKGWLPFPEPIIIPYGGIDGWWLLHQRFANYLSRSLGGSSVELDVTFGRKSN